MNKKGYLLVSLILCCGVMHVSHGQDSISQDASEHKIFRRLFPKSFGLRLAAITTSLSGALSLAMGFYDWRKIAKNKNKMLATEYERKKSEAQGLIALGAVCSGVSSIWAIILLNNLCKRNKPLITLTKDAITVEDTKILWQQIAKWHEKIERQDGCETNRKAELLNQYGISLATIDLHMINISRDELLDCINQYSNVRIRF